MKSWVNLQAKKDPPSPEQDSIEGVVFELLDGSSDSGEGDDGPDEHLLTLEKIEVIEKVIFAHSGSFFFLSLSPLGGFVLLTKHHCPRRFLMIWMQV